MYKTSISQGVIEVQIDVDSLDASNATETKAFFKQLDTSECQRAILNLESVNFIDSSGIGAILSFYKQMNQKLSLRNPTPTVLSVLELLRLHRVFQIESE